MSKAEKAEAAALSKAVDAATTPRSTPVRDVRHRARDAGEE